MNRDLHSDQDKDLQEILNLDRSSGRLQRLKWSLIWVMIVMAVLISGYIWFSHGRDKGIQYKTEQARRGNLTVTVSATGSLEPTNQVDVGIEVSGTIESVYVDYNDSVKVGQVLARLDTSKLRAQVLQSRAAVKVARARLEQTQATLRNAERDMKRLTRAWKISHGKVPSQKELDAAQATLDRARADVTSAKAEIDQRQATLDLNETNLSKAIVYSPINGIVLKRAVDPGQTVAATFQTPLLFTLAEDLSKMELHVDVDEADVGLVRSGQTASFSVDAYPDRSFPARITEVRFGPKTVAGVVTYETVMKVDNSELLLRPGMTATANIVVKQLSHVLLVPNAALRFTPPLRNETESSGSGGLVGTILPHFPRSMSKKALEEAEGKKGARVWTIRNGGLCPVKITVGATDGTMTEVKNGAVRPGMPMVVDVIMRP